MCEGGSDPETGILLTPEQRAQREQAEKNRRAEERDRLHRDTEVALSRKSVIVAAVGVGFGIVSLAFLGWQTWESHRSVTVAQEAIQVARDGVQVARDTLKASEREGQEADQRSREQNAISKDSLAVARMSLEAGKSHAQQAIDASTSALRLEQRAWLGVPAIDPIISGLKFGFRFKIVNTGKTPARRVFQITEWNARRTSAGPLDADKAIAAIKGSRQHQSDISPGASIGINHPGSEFPKEAFDAITATGVAIYYVYGVVTYDDIFDNPRCFRFCYQWRPEISGFSECQGTDQNWRRRERDCPK
jgi:hypothetical protein